MQSRLLYIIGHLRFMYINLDVMKITSHPEDGTVKVRWKITVFRVSSSAIHSLEPYLLLYFLETLFLFL